MTSSSLRASELAGTFSRSVIRTRNPASSRFIISVTSRAARSAASCATSGSCAARCFHFQSGDWKEMMTKEKAWEDCTVRTARTSVTSMSNYKLIFQELIWQMICHPQLLIKNDWPICACQYSFCSICQALQNLRTCAPLQTQFFNNISIEKSATLVEFQQNNSRTATC